MFITGCFLFHSKFLLKNISQSLRCLESFPQFLPSFFLFHFYSFFHQLIPIHFAVSTQFLHRFFRIVSSQLLHIPFLKFLSINFKVSFISLPSLFHNFRLSSFPWISSQIQSNTHQNHHLKLNLLLMLGSSLHTCYNQLLIFINTVCIVDYLVLERLGLCNKEVSGRHLLETAQDHLLHQYRYV